MTIPKFRQEALEHATSEQLNELIRLVSPKDWIILSTIWVLIALFIIWGVAGSIPTRVTGQGILLASNASIFDAIAPEGATRVVSIKVNRGDSVKHGDIVAYLDAPDLTKQAATAHSYLKKMHEKLTSLQSTAHNEINQRQILYDKQQSILQEAIKTQQEEIAALEDLLNRKLKLEKKQLVTREEAIKTLNDFNSSKQRLKDFLHQEIQHKETFTNFKQEWNQRLLTLELQYMEAHRDFERLQNQLTLSKVVKSPVSGTVTHIQVAIGDSIKPGDSIISIAGKGSGSGLDAIVFVPAHEGQKIKDGMEALISPETIEREKYGSLVGQVIAASHFPTNERSMLAILHNKELTNKFMQEGVPVAIRIHIKDNTQAYSGYEWTSGTGPELKVSPGLVVTAQITVRHEAPFSLIIPTLRKWWEGRT